MLVDQREELCAKAISDHHRGRYAQALAAIVPLALRNYAPAQLHLHRCYRHGTGVIKSQRLAAYWLLRAARSGDANAQEKVGGHFRDGRFGFKHSWAQARFWFQAAAAQNHPRALSQLAWMYFRGYGVTQDYRTAVNFFVRAHELGDHTATLNLAWFTERGLMVEQDFARARVLYEDSAAKGNAHAKFNLGTLYKRGVGVEIDRDKARHLFREAAAMGDREAVGALKVMDDEDEVPKHDDTQG